jgi:hypothetical protein
MADPLGISASIIAVIKLTGTVVQYINNVKSASEDPQRILNELFGVTGVLHHLKDLAEKLQYRTTWTLSLDSLYVPLGQLNKALDRLAAKLAPSHGIQKLERMLIWLFQKAEILEILNMMERQKSIFIIALCNDHMYVVNLHRYRGIGSNAIYSPYIGEFLEPSKVMYIK